MIFLIIFIFFFFCFKSRLQKVNIAIKKPIMLSNNMTFGIRYFLNNKVK